MHRIRYMSWRLLGRKLTAAVTLLAYGAATFGVPLPALAAKPSDQPFPCQAMLCGCESADQCWNECGCFTPQELERWSTEHNLPAPAAAPKSTPANQPQVKNDISEAPAAECCCSSGQAAKDNCEHCGKKTTQAPCCTPAQVEPSAPPPSAKPSKPDKQKTSCCDASAPASSGCQTRCGSAENKPAKTGVRWGTVNAWRCQGLTLHWVATGAVAPAGPPVVWRPVLDPCAWLAPTVSTTLRISFIPPDPPPRSC
jgi:hypothetical protein